MEITFLETTDGSIEGRIKLPSGDTTLFNVWETGHSKPPVNFSQYGADDDVLWQTLPTVLYIVDNFRQVYQMINNLQKPTK